MKLPDKITLNFDENSPLNDESNLMCEHGLNFFIKLMVKLIKLIEVFRNANN